jgi:hypothetical protein
VRYAVPGLFAVFLIEAWAASRWWPPYFSSGLVVFRRSVPWRHSVAPLPAVESLAERFRGVLGPSLVFCEIGPGEIAFREKLFEFRLLNYTPVMHGLLRLRPESSQVEVEGRANWFTIAFCLIFATFLWGFPGAWPMLGFLVGLLAVIGSLQATQYAKVATFVAEGAPTGESAPTRRVTPSVIVVTALAVAVFVGMALLWMAN